MSDPRFTADQIEDGRKLFAGEITFVKGVVGLQHLPEGDRAEFCFAGRSNVGKSSLINALANRRQLARASNTPGRTQELNFFNLGQGRLYMVDLPGYGFAEAPKETAEKWKRLMLDYLRGRATLKRVFVLIDSRRGVGEVDHEVMKSLDSSAVNYQIVLTKIDKLRKAAEVAAALADATDAIKKHGAAHPIILSTSSEEGIGLEELRAEIAGLG